MAAELAAGLAAGAAWVAVAAAPRRRMLLPSTRAGLLRPREHLRSRRAQRALVGDAPRLWWDTATEMRSGASLAVALRAAANEATEPTAGALGPAVAAASLGLNVPSRLRQVPEPSFRWAAAAVEVANEDGAGLAEALQRIGDLAAADRRHRQQQRALLAGSRATSRVLLGLPLLGVVLGWGFGADPVGFLFGTSIGRVCLASAIALDIAGWWWIRVLTRL